jgi:uncharacterized protein
MMPRILVSLAAATLICFGDVSEAAAAGSETFVEAPGPSGLLKGTLLSPEGISNPPIALIIPGSGPTDRDGNSPLGVRASTLRLLAEAMAERGVATARIDKRGMFASAGAVPDPNHVTISEYASDAQAWAKTLKQKTGAPCVWLIGHSEGALVAMAAAQTSTDFCGLVLAAGAGRKLGEVLRQQLKANPANAPLLDQALAAIDKLEAGQHVNVAGMHPALQGLFRPEVQDFLIEEMAYDPVTLLKTYKGPVLVVQGANDLQVSMDDADLLIGARPGISVAKLEGVNHVLKSAPIDRQLNFATYADPSLPLGPGVADSIARFVKPH